MDLRLDDLGVGNLKIWQDKDLFCFGTDAVLLANFVSPKPKDTVLDIGTGNGIIPLLLTAKCDAKKITGLEIQPASFALAQKNVEYNNLTDKIEITEGDINDKSLFPAASFSYITCNPPYKPMGTGLKNPTSPLAIARHEVLCTLEDIIKRSAYLLKSKGKLAMVHKPERAAQIIYLMKENRIEPKRILMVYPRENTPPCLILIEGMKDGNEGVKWETPLTVYDKDGNYTAHCNMLYQKSKENNQ